MSGFTMKTYKDSYLYYNKVSKSNDSADAKTTSNALLDFIKNSHRIDAKTGDAFRGVVEDIKYQNDGAVIYAVLMDPRVVICIGNAELPRAFKVFDAYDKKNSGQPAVFIDATGIIEFKNGRYFCKKIDVLCAYLFDAMIYLMYRNFPTKIVSNSSVILPATECYVSMFSYIVDYMRIIGYSVNQKKINYLTGLFFLHNMAGLELIDSTKNIAAKIADVTPVEIKAYDLYLDDNIFTNIETFVNALVRTFNLKGLTLEAFVSKWIYLFGTGTQYGCELLTSFLVTVVNACSGCYIVNQRTIQRCCGKNNASPMVKLYISLKKAGTESFNARNYAEAATHITTKETRELAESLSLRTALNEKEHALNSKDYKNKEDAKTKSECTVKACKEARSLDKLNKYANASISNGIDAAYLGAKNIIEGKEAGYDTGALLEVAKVFKKQLNDNQRYNIENVVRKDINHLRELVSESTDKEVFSSVNSIISELREIQTYI